MADRLGGLEGNSSTALSPTLPLLDRFDQTIPASTTADRPFKCHHCPISFTSQNALNGHQNAHRIVKKVDLELKLATPACDLSSTRGSIGASKPPNRGRGRPRGSTRRHQSYERPVVGNYPSGGTVSKPAPMGSWIRAGPAGHGEGVQGEGGDRTEEIDLELKLGFW